MSWKDVSQALLEFVSKALEDASLWFWLVVSSVALLIADSYKLIVLASIPNSPRTILIVLAAFAVGLWLNALQLHRFLAKGLTWLWSKTRKYLQFVGAKMRSRRPTRKTLAFLKKVLNMHCHERRVLLMLMSQREPKLYRSTASHENEFRGALTLEELGILMTYGEGSLKQLLVPYGVSRAFRTLAGGEPLASELEKERQVIREKGKAALVEDLPRFLSELYWSQQKSS